MTAGFLQYVTSRVNQIAKFKPRKYLLRSYVFQNPNYSSLRQAYSVASSQLQDAQVLEPPASLALNHDTSITKPRQILHNDEGNTVPSSGKGNTKRQLPISCPGCGGLAQEEFPEEPGYYTRSRRAVKAYLKRNEQHPVNSEDGSETVTQSTKSQLIEDSAWSEKANGIAQITTTNLSQTADIPICDRCHNLMFNSSGTSIAHPSIENIAESITESPFKRNHVYHVLDAADFPMSIVPGIFRSLSLAKPRSQNRRSQHDFSQKPTLSFIVTRSDLLGPTKEIVDTMMPYFQSVLRTALGRTGRDIRLGNLHLVSAKRGWWTTEIKESIWKRGGGNWMVGKFNVGKSNLFEVLFPRGSGERAPIYAELEHQQKANTMLSVLRKDEDQLSDDSLLPPPQPESRFPVFPLVSTLPGTTASPIRLPFGGHRGELIDLPGLQRSKLDEFVSSDHKLDLVMTNRPNVTQYNIKPGQSLLLGGGLIRITPLSNEDDGSSTMLAYPFVPLDVHVTSTEKAIGTQLQERESGIKSILDEGAGTKIKSAGTYSLSTEVTKHRAGPLLRAGVDLSSLAFQIYSTDILIEGVGWVELVCQVRRSRSSNIPNMTTDTSEQAPSSNAETFSPFNTSKSTQNQSRFPQVEIFAPNGEHIGQRRPLGAWQLWNDGKGKPKKASTANRPRRSIKAQKLREKTSVSRS